MSGNRAVKPPCSGSGMISMVSFDTASQYQRFMKETRTTREPSAPICSREEIWDEVSAHHLERRLINNPSATCAYIQVFPLNRRFLRSPFPLHGKNPSANGLLPHTQTHESRSFSSSRSISSFACISLLINTPNTVTEASLRPYWPVAFPSASTLEVTHAPPPWLLAIVPQEPV